MPVLLLFYREVSTLASYIANKQSEIMDLIPQFVYKLITSSSTRLSYQPQNNLSNIR